MVDIEYSFEQTLERSRAGGRLDAEVAARLAPVAPGRAIVTQLAEIAGRLTALGLFVLALPGMAVLLARAWRGGVRLARRSRIGQHGRAFDEIALEPVGESPALDHSVAGPWAVLLNVIRGDMALVGPRARSPRELGDPRLGDLLAVKPGVICSWWIRRRRGMDYGSELEADLEYVRTRGPRTDLGLLARAAAAVLYGDGVQSAAPESRVLGVRTDNLAMDAAVERIASMAAGTAANQVSFANADCLNLACRNEAYRAALASARLVLPDGVGIRLASKMTGQSIRHNVNGTDLFPLLCDRLARDGRRVFLLGGRPGIAEKVSAYIQERHPGLTVAGTRNGYFTPAEERAVVDQVRSARADVLLVAFGAPRQDVWIRDHLTELGVGVAMGVGGLFDFYSFTLPRAPVWIRELGMEWAFRLANEPRRLWRRYVIGNVVFLARVLLEASGLVQYGPAPLGIDHDALPERQAIG